MSSDYMFNKRDAGSDHTPTFKPYFLTMSGRFCPLLVLDFSCLGFRLGGGVFYVFIAHITHRKMTFVTQVPLLFQAWTSEYWSKNVS